MRTSAGNSHRRLLRAATSLAVAWAAVCAEGGPPPSSQDLWSLSELDGPHDAPAPQPLPHDAPLLQHDAPFADGAGPPARSGSGFVPHGVGSRDAIVQGDPGSGSATVSPLFAAAAPQPLAATLGGDAAPYLPPAAGRVPYGPGYLTAVGRYRGLPPVAPQTISAHEPLWEVLPAPDAARGEAPLRLPHSHDCRVGEARYLADDFTPDPNVLGPCPVPGASLAPYGDKTSICGTLPICELGVPFYGSGPLPPAQTWFGRTNPAQPKFYVYGDFRTALAENNSAGNTRDVWASRLNLDVDLWLTATERFHGFWGPLDENNQFSSIFVESGEMEIEQRFSGWDETTDTLFFEGDLGYMVGGWRGIDAPFDLPIAVGLVPLFLQNGIWMDDAIVGAAATIPARNDPWLDWSNFDTTFFVGFEELTTPAFGADADEANLAGVHAFIDRRGGYIELGWAYVDDPTDRGLSYHNFAASYSRRYLNLVSSAARAIVNVGQGGPADQRTADGCLLLLENSLLTPLPYNVVPYANLFAGFDRPQALARVQGPLQNTGVNFETDLLTGYPTLDASGHNAYGGAVGVDLLGRDLDRQLILEAATVQPYGDAALRQAPGDQYAVGVRVQQVLNRAWLIRGDMMFGWLENADDISGMRAELRRKF